MHEPGAALDGLPPVIVDDDFAAMGARCRERLPDGRGNGAPRLAFIRNWMSFTPARASRATQDASGTMG